MSDTKAITFNRLPILGKSKVDFEDWKFSYERWCKSNNVDEDEKLECLISITEGVARTIVINSLNKDEPDDYKTTINKLKDHYKSSLPKNSRLLELSTIIIKKGESVNDFNTKFDTLLNKINLKLTDEVIVSYYINAFRNFTRTYETLLESEPRNLEEAKKITSKKEKIYYLVESNRPKNKLYVNNNRKGNYNIENNIPRNNNNSNFNRNNNNNNNNNNFNRNNPFTNNFRNNSFTSNSNRNNSFTNNSNRNNSFANNSNRNYYNYNNNSNLNNNNFQKPNNLNQGIEYRRNSLRHTQNSNDDLQEITKRLADLKINVCINCQRIGHIVEECPELEDSEHLN